MRIQALLLTLLRDFYYQSLWQEAFTVGGSPCVLQTAQEATLLPCLVYSSSFQYVFPGPPPCMTGLRTDC